MNFLLKKGWAAIILFVPLYMISCSDDYLDVSDPEAISPAVFPSEVSDLDLMLIDVYGRLRNGIYNSDIFARVGIGPDHTADQGFNGANFNEWFQNIVLPQDNQSTNLWQDHFDNVSRANSLLSSIEDFRAGDVTDQELEDMRIIEGQAKFLRALNYYFLVQFFGETAIANDGDRSRLGVPLWDGVAASIEETSKPRATLGENWDFIISDLQEAASLLEGVVWDEANRPRVDEWAAKSLLGKAYVFTLQYNEAATVLQEVVEQSGKSLVPFETLRSMFNGQNEFNSESIFEVNFTADRQNTWNGQANTSTQYGVIVSPSFVNPDGTVGTNGFGNLFIHDKNVERFGFDLPAFTADEQQDPEYIAESIRMRENFEVDPRMTVGSLQPFVDSIFINDMWLKVGKNVGEGFDLGNNRAWCHRKNVLIDRNLWSGNSESIDANMYVLRLADVYLLYAEALINSGNESMGLEYINKVKRRAFGQDIDSASPFDYTSVSDRTMASAEDHLANDPLKYERWAELFAEGQWWFDVRRWRIGAEEASYYESVKSGPLGWSDTKYAFPIPEVEINGNSALQKQNDGY